MLLFFLACNALTDIASDTASDTKPPLPEITKNSCGAFSFVLTPAIKHFGVDFYEFGDPDSSAVITYNSRRLIDEFRCEPEGLYLISSSERDETSVYFIWDQPALLWPAGVGPGDAWSLTLTGSALYGDKVSPDFVEKVSVDLEFKLTETVVETGYGPVEAMLLETNGATVFTGNPGPSVWKPVAIHDGWGVVAYGSDVLTLIE